MFIVRLSGTIIRYARICLTNIVNLQSIINVVYEWVPIKKWANQRRYNDKFLIGKRIRVKFRDHSGQNLVKLKFEVEHSLNNHVEINQDVSANTNHFCNNLFVIYSQCCRIKEKEIYFKDFAFHGSLMLLLFC